MQYKKLSQLLHSAPDLSKFIAKLGQLEQISHYVAATMEPVMSSQCRVANLRDGTLILSTTSPAWNHKLRFMTVDLLSALRKNPAWCGLKSIEVRVDYLPNTKPNNAPTKKQLSISTYNAKLIAETANGVTCVNLAKSLERLAARAQQIKHEN